MPRNCVNSADNFCYACGKAIFLSRKRNKASWIKKKFTINFRSRKWWSKQELGSTSSLTNACNITYLNMWLNKKKKTVFCGPQNLARTHKPFYKLVLMYNFLLDLRFSANVQQRKFLFLYILGKNLESRS